MEKHVRARHCESLLLSLKGHRKERYREPQEAGAEAEGSPTAAAALHRRVWPLPIWSPKGLAGTVHGEEG